MDSSDLLVFLRYALTAGLTGLVASGKLTSDQASTLTNSLIQVATSILAALPVVWGLIHHNQQKAAVITAAATGQPVQATIASPIVSPHA